MLIRNRKHYTYHIFSFVTFRELFEISQNISLLLCKIGISPLSGLSVWYIRRPIKFLSDSLEKQTWTNSYFDDY